MEARQYREMLDIQMVSNMKFEYYTLLRDKYQGIILPETKELPPRPPRPLEGPIDAASPEAREVVFHAFKLARRSFEGGARGG